MSVSSSSSSVVSSGSKRRAPDGVLAGAPAPFRAAVDAHLSSSQEDVATTTPPQTRLGENGAVEFTNTGLGANILALSQLVRGGDVSALAKQVLAATGGDDSRNNTNNLDEIIDLIVLVFVTRNTRGGKGEKDLAYDLFLHVWEAFPATATKLLSLFSHYGYWKDLLLLSEKAAKKTTQSGQQQETAKAVLKESIRLMKEQFYQDVTAVNSYENDLAATTDQTTNTLPPPKISLVAKWLPRENKALDKKLDFVAHWVGQSKDAVDTAADNTDNDAQKIWQSTSKADYRKALAKTTALLDLPEVLLSAHREDEIKFGKLASKATLRLTKVLLNESKDGTDQRSTDPKRIRMAELFVEHMTQKGLKGGQVMPHEIVHQIMTKGNISSIRAKVLDAQWKDLWRQVVESVKAKAKEEGVEFDPTRMVPLSDVSGSMGGVPMEVSIALGIGISEITHPAFQHMVLTFESTPRWHRLNAGDSIVEKVQSLQRAPWGGSTNFEGAYDLILQVCLENQLKREDVPALIVFSDMQFNMAAGHHSYGYQSEASALSYTPDTLHNVVRGKFAETAKTLGWSDDQPTPIVYWNLRSTGGHPVEKNTNGAVLLSGFSPSLLKLVMNGEALKEEEVEVVADDGTVHTEKMRVTPEQVLRKMLDDPLYDPVRAILAESEEGALAGYRPLMSEEIPTNDSEEYEMVET